MVFSAVVFLSYLILSAIGFVPEPIKDDEAMNTEEVDYSFNFVDVFTTVFGLDKDDIDNNEDTIGVSALAVRDSSSLIAEKSSTTASGLDATPNRLIIDELGKDVVILNPTQNSLSALDAALLEGVVRHPDTADFADTGNMLIVGHSSYLPNVFNKNFQALNGLQNLTWGDLIRVQSLDTEYIYRVERVYKAKATELVVPNDRGEARLTLATCNTFGAKEDRFVVEAILVETKSL